MTPQPDHPAAADRLRSVGLRVTAPRIAVLEVVEERPHRTADAVTAAVRRRIGAVSPQTVYDALRALTDTGLARRIEPAGSPARYETRVGDNHHHVVCRGCGRIEDVDCAVGHAPCLAAGDTHGFLVDEAEVTYWGLCPRCRAAAPTPPDQTTRPVPDPDTHPDPRPDTQGEIP